jgi:hypothetical protein
MLLPGGAGTTVADQDYADRRPLDAEVSALSPWTVIRRLASLLERLSGGPDCS